MPLEPETALQRAWPELSPPDDLADRIVAHATQLPQRRPRLAGLRAWFARPDYASWRGVALAAACVMIAVIALQPSRNQTTAAATKYRAPMEQMVEEMLWSDTVY